MVVVLKHYNIIPLFRHLATMTGKSAHRILITFGDNLKKHRKAMGLSLRQLAALADTDHAMIDRYERGATNPSLTTLAKLAEALEIEPHELLMKKG
jgi:predicted transcriptional regulator